MRDQEFHHDPGAFWVSEITIRIPADLSPKARLDLERFVEIQRVVSEHASWLLRAN